MSMRPSWATSMCAPESTTYSHSALPNSAYPSFSASSSSSSSSNNGPFLYSFDGGRGGDTQTTEREMSITRVCLKTARASAFDADPYGPDEIVAIAEPIRICRPEAYVVDPHVFKVDTLSTEEINDINGFENETTRDENGQPVSVPYKWRTAFNADPPQRFQLKWPARANSKLHLNTGTVIQHDLTFQTPSEAIRIGDFYDLPGRASKHHPIADKHGNIVMKFNSRQLKMIMNKSVPGIGTQNYNFIPLRIEIIKEMSNLPITYHAQLTAAAPHQGGAVEWSTPTGGHTYGEHTEDVGVTHHTIFQKQKIQSSDERKVLFQADWRYNSPEFSRWINVDEKELLSELKKSRRSEGTFDFALVACPPEDAVEAENVLQFVCVDEWLLLHRYAVERKLALPAILDEQGKTSQFRIPYEALDFVIRRHLTSIDRNTMVMKLEDLRWTLSPLKTKKHGINSLPIGESDLSILVNQIQNAHVAGTTDALGLYPNYIATIRITGECYTGNSTVSTSNSAHPNGATLMPTIYSQPVAMSILHPSISMRNPIGTSKIVYPSLESSN